MRVNCLLVAVCVLTLNQRVLGGLDPANVKDVIPGYDANGKAEWVSNINKQRGYLYAANMNSVEWCDGLADKAQEWVEQCSREHQPAADRVFNGASYSQAIYWHCPYRPTGSPSSIAYQFYRMKSSYKYDTKSCISVFGSEAKCNSFLAFANAAVTQIGCGHAFCVKKTRKGRWTTTAYFHSFACNFSPGYVAGQNPYEKGDVCSQCPSDKVCINKLCTNCESLICQNCGTRNGCKCDCKPGYIGVSCEKKCENTKSYCPRRGSGVDYYCKKNNVSTYSQMWQYYRYYCPYTCTQCEKFTTEAKC